MHNVLKIFFCFFPLFLSLSLLSFFFFSFRRYKVDFFSSYLRLIWPYFYFIFLISKECIFFVRFDVFRCYYVVGVFYFAHGRVTLAYCDFSTGLKSCWMGEKNVAFVAHFYLLCGDVLDFFFFEGTKISYNKVCGFRHRTAINY